MCHFSQAAINWCRRRVELFRLLTCSVGAPTTSEALTYSLVLPDLPFLFLSGNLSLHQLSLSSHWTLCFQGQASVDAVANRPQSLITGMNAFLKNLDITFRRDPTNYRPRINKGESVKDREQKLAGTYYYIDMDEWLLGRHSWLRTVAASTYTSDLDTATASHPILCVVETWNRWWATQTAMTTCEFHASHASWCLLGNDRNRIQCEWSKYAMAF